MQFRASSDFGVAMIISVEIDAAGPRETSAFALHASLGCPAAASNPLCISARGHLARSPFAWAASGTLSFLAALA